MSVNVDLNQAAETATLSAEDREVVGRVITTLGAIKERDRHDMLADRQGLPWLERMPVMHRWALGWDLWLRHAPG